MITMQSTQDPYISDDLHIGAIIGGIVGGSLLLIGGLALLLHVHKFSRVQTQHIVNPVESKFTLLTSIQQDEFVQYMSLYVLGHLLSMFGVFHLRLISQYDFDGPPYRP